MADISMGKEPQGTVLEILRMSTEDGPGLRTTVFFKGCTLRCSWCHKPECINTSRELQWLKTRCIGCGTCAETCSEKAITINHEGIAIDRELCTCCGQCADQCPSTAMEILGSEWTVEELVKELVKDRAYFDTSGGITASGGEAAIQADFVAALFRRLKEEGIHTALDTSGHCSLKKLETIIPFSDLVMYDLKEIDPARHRAFTGMSNETVIENFVSLTEFARNSVAPREVWVRTPIIPGTTDTTDNISGIGALISAHGENIVSRWELCAFNNLCKDKYARLDMVWEFNASRLLEKKTMEMLADTARASIKKPSIVCWSGTTRLDKERPENKQGRSDNARGSIC
jgi:pyruvate formate lyase activating enzyme